MTQTMDAVAAERRQVTTEELLALLEAGYTVRLPEVAEPDPEVLKHYGDEQQYLGVDEQSREIASVEYVRDDEVQCISVADERHLYITDDFIPTHNTSNIVFLKSTDDSMIETLEKMSGKTHVAYMDSKTVTKDTEAVLKFSNVEGKVSYTMNTKEEPVIKYNDMAFLSERNSIVFRAGDPPVWNRNETILPMSWRLFKDTIEHPGHDYSLQTIPTLSSALEFDVRGNQPDFQAMLMKRMHQAEAAVDAKRIYQEVFELKEADIARLDPDVYADSIMELVDVTVREEEAAEDPGADTADEVNPWEVDYAEQIEHFDMVENTQQAQINQEYAAAQAQRQAKIFAEKRVAKEDLITASGAVTGWLDDVLVEVYKAVKQDLARDGQFQVDGTGNLRSADGSTVYITKLDESEAKAQLREDSESEDSRVYAEDGQDVASLGSYQVEEAFYRFLESQSSWLDIAEGEFDREVVKQMQIRENA